MGRKVGNERWFTLGCTLDSLELTKLKHDRKPSVYYTCISFRFFAVAMGYSIMWVNTLMIPLLIEAFSLF